MMSSLGYNPGEWELYWVWHSISERSSSITSITNTLNIYPFIQTFNKFSNQVDQGAVRLDTCKFQRKRKDIKAHRPAACLSLQESVLPAAVSYWGQALRVRRTESRIRLNRKCQQNQVSLNLILTIFFILSVTVIVLIIFTTRCFSSRTVFTLIARMLASR